MGELINLLNFFRLSPGRAIKPITCAAQFEPLA